MRPDRGRPECAQRTPSSLAVSVTFLVEVKAPRDALRDRADEHEPRSDREERPTQGQRSSIGDHPEPREQQQDSWESCDDW